MKKLFVVFLSVLAAELGDKTQVATFLFATDPGLSRTGIFVASASALVLSSLLAVLLGNRISQHVSPTLFRTLAGCGFIGIGLWLVVSARR